jgi:hypothetical protein
VKYDDTGGSYAPQPSELRRRPRRGCARMPIGTHPHLLVVGVGNHIAAPLWDGRGLGGVSQPLLSARPTVLGKAMYGGRLEVIYVHYEHQGRAPRSRSGRPICFPSPDTTKIPHYLRGWGMYLMSVWGRGGYRRISGGLRVLELAADNRNGRSLDVNWPCGRRVSLGSEARREASSRRSQPHKRLGLAAAILRISRHREAMYVGFFGKI